jgi:mRNA-degrading endonuclease toxin of MazEF toxin-antitoxin module
MARFHFGQIVNVSIHIGKKAKVRPVVLIDADGDHEIDGEILAIVISSRLSRPCPSYHVKVHNSTNKDPHTGLSKPSWAKCNICRHVDVTLVKDTVGYMPDDLLDKIVAAFDRIDALGDKFPDWQ